MTKSAMILIKSSISDFPRVSEALRIAVSMIGMDMMPRLLFCSDGVYCLSKHSECLKDEKSAEYLGILSEMAGINVLSSSLQDKGLIRADLMDAPGLQVIDREAASRLFSESDIVLAL